ncbi:MAG: putative inorganic carbon transporter subunit DabA, partial [Flavisolibacter sp.]
MGTILRPGSDVGKKDYAEIHHAHFNEKHVLHELKHYLPSQTPLKDFIHHNSLHALQNLKFYDAIFKASKVFGYQVTLQLLEFRDLFRNGRIREDVLDKIIIEKKGVEHLEHWKHNLIEKNYNTAVTARIGRLRSHWKSQYKIDLDNMVQPVLFRILSSYLDQGISMWKFPTAENGFLASIRELEKNSFSSFFKSKRAKNLVQDPIGIGQLLKIVVGNEGYFEQYLFDQQFSHRGWSGIVSTIEDQPHTLLDTRKISLHDLIIFELLLEIDALDSRLGTNWKPLTSFIHSKPAELFADVAHSEVNEVFSIWQDAFEWSYYDDVLAGISLQKRKAVAKPKPKTFQAMFCIDERECSLRRHIEFVDTNCETLGTPGFFGVEFYFQPEKGLFYDKLCPAPVTPKYLIKEFDVKDKRKHELLYSSSTHSFFGGTLSTLTLGFWSGLRLFQNIFKPKMSPAISNAFAHMNKHGQLTIENKRIEDRENDLQVGFTVDEMTARVEG